MFWSWNYVKTICSHLTARHEKCSVYFWKTYNLAFQILMFKYIYMFCKTYILAFQRFSTAVETMLWTLKWSWNILPQGELRNPHKFMVLQKNVAPAQHHPPLSHWANLMLLAGFCTNGLSASREILGGPNATGISQMQLLKSEYWTCMLNDLALAV